MNSKLFFYVLHSWVEDLKSVKALSSRGGTAPLHPPVYALATCQSIDPYISSYPPILLNLLYFHLRLIFCLNSSHSSLFSLSFFINSFCYFSPFSFPLLPFSVSISLLFLFIFPYPPILYFSLSLFFHMFSLF